MSRIENILKNYADDKRDSYKFYGYVSPPETDEQFRWVKECGLTHLHVFYDAIGKERFEKALELAEKNDFKLIWIGADFLKEDRPYVKHPAFDGIYVDEPLSIGDLEMLVRQAKEYRQLYPEKRFYINMVGMRGESWKIYSTYYKEHFLANVNEKYVSSDGYALREPNANGTTFTTILENIREVGQLAAETDSEMYYFIQTMSLHGNGWNHPARRPSTEDIRFQYYIVQACGATGFAHFCYRSPDRMGKGEGEFLEEDYACIHWDGTRTPIWYSVREVISEFKKFENIALKFKWKGIMPIYGKQAEKRSENFDDLSLYVQSHSYIKAVKAEQDLLIGCFEDKDGNIGFTLVNFCDPYQKKENPICIMFDTDEPVAVIRNGELEIVSLKDGVYTAVLAPGEGQFVIIPKKTEAKLEKYLKECTMPDYLVEPKSYCWKDDFTLGNQVDTYNVFGSGNSHFEFMESGYPEGGSGRVLRLYSSTTKDKDWSSYKFLLPDIPADANKKLVFKLYFTASSFVAYVSCDHMNNACAKCGTASLERYGRWTWFEVPISAIRNKDIPVISEVGLCIGSGVPFGTTAYLDEILLCDI